MAMSAQEFIKALKAPLDPPQADGPPKIAIAGNAWHNGTVYIPNKEEAIVDWILTRLLKEKDKERCVFSRLESGHSDINVITVSQDCEPALRRTLLGPPERHLGHF